MKKKMPPCQALGGSRPPPWRQRGAPSSPGSTTPGSQRGRVSGQVLPVVESVGREMNNARMTAFTQRTSLLVMQKIPIARERKRTQQIICCDVRRCVSKRNHKLLQKKGCQLVGRMTLSPIIFNIFIFMINEVKHCIENETYPFMIEINFCFDVLFVKKKGPSLVKQKRSRSVIL